MILGAHTSADKKGRHGPSFFLCGCLFWSVCASGAALAQQAIYRCGQEYTNAPSDASRCERVITPAITVIPGTRVQTPQPGAGLQSGTGQGPGQGAGQGAAVSSPAPTGPISAVPGQREEMARGILSTELEQARQRHARLLQAHQRAEAERRSEEAQGSEPDRERQARLQAALERSQRDIDSLQRELARRPLSSAAP